jgi:hypothetical protein
LQNCRQDKRNSINEDQLNKRALRGVYFFHPVLRPFVIFLNYSI